MVISGTKWEKAGDMLIGQYEGKVDAKGRTALPKKLREELGDKLIITLGYENSLIIVSESGWKALLEGTGGKPFIQKEARETQRFLLGGASQISLDGKGRFVIPYYLREFGKIKNQIVFIGLYRYVEIWDKSLWEEYRKHLQNNIERISKRLIQGESRPEPDRK